MPLIAKKSDIPLNGEITPAPDKSISHRSIIFSSIANGVSKIYNLLEGEDVIKTIKAMQLMGVEISKKIDSQNQSFYEINGSGIVGLMEPQDILDMGNSGTSTRLLAGLVSPYDFTSFFTGDNSLRKRPMNRIFEPIKKFGAKIISRQNNLLPFAVIGNGDSLPIEYRMKMASAQVKSAILLASLSTRGQTTIIEPQKCRDHTEIMMKSLGLKISQENFFENNQNGTKISYHGMQEFAGRDFYIPNDISSSAFFMVACLLIKNSKITLKNVGVNPLRTGLIETLQEMGGKILLTNIKEINGEKVADIIVEYSKLKGITVPASRSASMIDEYPILSIACAFAEGESHLLGLEELKAKESNRLQMIATNLENCGVAVKFTENSLSIKGGFVMPKNLVAIKTAMDHRIAMSFLVMGLCLENGIEIDDDSMIATSFPNFFNIFNQFNNQDL
jgi:3-phosphoshikimate 1-carboxyvinyltransferase